MYYADASALVKLIVKEKESDALASWWQNVTHPTATSALTRTELLRAVGRRAPERSTLAAEVLSRLAELDLDRGLLERAATMGPVSLRSLDAIHLASAERLGSDLSAVVTYDDRMMAAAVHLGMPVVSPA